MPREFQGGPSEADKEFKAPTTEIQSTNPTNMRKEKSKTSDSINEAVGQFMEQAETEAVNPQLEQYLESADNEILKAPEKPKTDKEKIKEILEAKLSKEEMEAHEKAYREIDSVTGLSGRGDQNAYIERAIFEATHNKAPETVALLNIDVNDLKVVNDAGNHTAGDMFLRRIGETLKNSTQEISQLVKGLEFQVGRDGGDEFSVCLKGNTDLNQKLESMDSETLHSLMQNSLIKEIAGKDKDSSLINIINKYVSRKCSEQNHNDLFLEGEQQKLYQEALKTNPESAKDIARKAMQEKISKAKPEKGEAPKDLEFVSYVSMNGSTLADIKKTPDANNFKNFHKGEAITGADSALKTYMGALRTHTDKMAIEDKKRLKTELAESQSAADRYRGTLGRPISVDKTIANIQKEIRKPITGESLKDALEKLANSL